MSILNTELRSIGNARTGRAKTQAEIDEYIKNWVNDLTLRGIFLEGEEEVNFVDEQPNYVESAFTNTYKRIVAITVEDTDGDESKPLLEISWPRYKERIAQGVDAGKPREYARFNDTIFVWPKPDADLYPLMNISGSIYHSDSTTISYPTRFRKCGIEYIIFSIYASFGYAETKGKPHWLLFETEVAKMLSDQSTKEKHSIRYTDI